ncbi:MAG TPA: TolC family protein, partial [Desulfatiglandales bacterium]|nr:TolC family protein [Desulfatiglandales bacterium]
EESIKIALERSLSVLSADEEIRAKEFEERAAKAGFYPTLSTSYSYTRIDNSTVNDAKATTYPYNPLTGTHVPWEISPLTRDNYEWDLTATQPLFTGWRLTLSKDLASLGIDIAKIQKETAVQDLVLDVKAAYFGILKAEKLETVAKQAVDLLEAQLGVSQAFYEEGIIAKNDLLQTQVQMAQARQDLIRATNGVALAKSRFNTLLRRGIDEETRIKDILDYEPVTLELSSALERAEVNRPEIKEVSLSVLSAEKRVQLSKSGYYPSVTLIGNYKRETDDWVLEAVSGEDPDIWTITVQGEWTFWEWGKTKHEVAAARARLAKARHLLNEVKDNIQLDVKNAYLSLREAEKNIQVAKTAVVQAEENFRMNEERYKQQVATATDVLNAQTLLTQARTNYFNALSDHNIAWARLERAMGIGYETGER